MLLTGPVTTAPEPVDQVPEKPVELEVKSCWAETNESCLAGSKEAIRREEESVRSDRGVNILCRFLGGWLCVRRRWIDRVYCQLE